MTEKPEDSETSPIEKLLIDNPSDFQFHAAYLAYSDTFDKATNPETRKELNQNIIALQQNQIDYPTFYRNISQYRHVNGFRETYHQTFIRTQKKQEWRRKTQKQEREKRHGR